MGFTAIVSGALHICVSLWTTPSALLDWRLGEVKLIAILLKPGVKMRAMARSLRHVRFAFRHQNCNYSGGFVKTRNHLMGTNTGTACQLTNRNSAELDRFRYHTFMISRFLSVGAAEVTNGGCFSFLVVINCKFFPFYLMNLYQLWHDFPTFCRYVLLLVQLQNWIEQGL